MFRKFVVSFNAIIISIFCKTLIAATYPVGLKPFYFSGNLGILQGIFNVTYTDITDIIPQNIAETVQQNGYSASINFGYGYFFGKQYYLGLEISGKGYANKAYFNSGASTTAFIDNTEIYSTVDFVAVPGLMLADSLLGYFKIGPSIGFLRDQLTSPVGYTPTMTTYVSYNQGVWGVIAGFGLRKYINKYLSLFVEYDFQDYSNINFVSFVNFTADYTHSVNVITNAINLGAAFHF